MTMLLALALLAAAADNDKTLDALAGEYWEARLAARPEEATFLGDRRYDDRLSDVSLAGRAAERKRLEGFLSRLRIIPREALSGPSRITWGALDYEIESGLDRLACALEDFDVDPRGGPQVGLPQLVGIQALDTPEAGRKLLARLKAMGGLVDDHVANLKLGLTKGRLAPRATVERVVRQLDDMLSAPLEASPFLEPLKRLPADWPAADAAALRDGATAAVHDVVHLALARYRDFLKKEVLPRARPDERVGLVNVPGGEACYRRLVRIHTSLDVDPEDLHGFGVEENARVRKEMVGLGRKLFGTDDYAAILKRLRTDPALFFKTADEIEAKAEATLRKAEAATPRFFERLPRTACGVRRIEPYEAKDATIGYYRPPSADGSRPGAYFINTYAPETRPRYEAEVLAFHESVPGHHFQISRAQELSGIPEFRKHQGVTAFVEGWALYCERLAIEMGLYSGDLDRMGMLSFDAWRASRLVVDTGMHAKGWSRQQAIDYMLANTALAENNVVNEVDRYIAVPAQALAYKAGQREILRLRAEAERRLGPKFDVKAFHERVLENGAVGLGVLRDRVESWISDAEK